MEVDGNQVKGSNSCPVPRTQREQCESSAGSQRVTNPGSETGLALSWRTYYSLMRSWERVAEVPWRQGSLSPVVKDLGAW